MLVPTQDINEFWSTVEIIWKCVKKQIFYFQVEIAIHMFGIGKVKKAKWYCD